MGKFFTTIAGLQCYLRGHNSVGLVPTMGALHAGHLSLVRRAKQENDCVVVSIFVNPLQFGKNEDYGKYPRTLEADLELCSQAGVDVVFAPAVGDMIGASSTNLSTTQVVPPQSMTEVMCGKFRPIHFPGVATIVTKLLHIVKPHRVYFGQKDGQQLAILRQMVQALNFPVEVIGCPIVRESNGLALSSRNQYLQPEQLDKAALLYQGLNLAATAFNQQNLRSSVDLIAIVSNFLAKEPIIEIEYIELVDAFSLQTISYLEHGTSPAMLAIAARIGATRLIDNILLSTRKPIIAIDGPAGAGKSTVAKLVAEKSNFLYLDTGAMYRAITWAVLQAGIDFDDEAAIAELTSLSHIKLQPSSQPNQPLQVFVNDRNITSEIRTPEVTSKVSAIASQAFVRQLLVKHQQELGKQGGAVMEGRDIGTTVFPDAEVKVFLTASVQERAKRRQQDLINQGQPLIDLKTLEASISDRDYKDSNRQISPLRQADDAIVINTDGLTIPEVVERITNLSRFAQNKV